MKCYLIVDEILWCDVFYIFNLDIYLGVRNIDVVFIYCFFDIFQKIVVSILVLSVGYLYVNIEIQVRGCKFVQVDCNIVGFINVMILFNNMMYYVFYVSNMVLVIYVNNQINMLIGVL